MDPILNSLNIIKNCMVDSTENHKFDLRVKVFIRWRRRRNEVSWCVITMNMLN